MLYWYKKLFFFQYKYSRRRGAAVADIALVDADLKGANCKWSPDTLDDRCSKNVNVTSSKTLGIS